MSFDDLHTDVMLDNRVEECIKLYRDISKAIEGQELKQELKQELLELVAAVSGFTAQDLKQIRSISKLLEKQGDLVDKLYPALIAFKEQHFPVLEFESFELFPSGAGRDGRVPR